MSKRPVQSRAIHRAKIISGQLEGIIRALERGEPCSQILIQTLAIRGSLESLNELMIENYLQTNFPKFKYPGEKEEFIKEVHKIYHLHNK